MKRLSSLLGLLFTLLLLWHPHAHADDFAVDCGKLLGNPSPLSPYTQKVLDRIKKADTGGGGGGGGSVLDIVQYMGAVIVSTVDTAQRIAAQGQSLRERTTCQQYDLDLLECKLEDTRKKINAAVSGSDYAQAFRLESLYSFINNRMRALILGSRDQNYLDTTWGEVQPFDPPDDPVWCCVTDGNQCKQEQASDCTGEDQPFKTAHDCEEAGCSAPAQEPQDEEKNLCPFTTDYLPAATEGFGCDQQTLQKIAGSYPPAQEELDEDKTINGKINSFRKKAKSLLLLEQQINTLLGVTPPPPPASSSSSSSSSHRVVSGCYAGQCSPGGQTCGSNNDCQSPALCKKGWMVCAKDQLKPCQSDSDCGDKGGKCAVQTPPDYLAWETRGPFSAVRDEPTLLTIFLRQKAAEPREYPDDLKLPFEMSSKSEGEPLLSPFDIFKQNFRAAIRVFTENQQRNTADLFARGADPVYATADSLQPLRDASKPVMTLAGSQTGLRQLVSRFAWFLRRTCLSDACNNRLEQILNIVRTDSCFPYVSGAFQKQTCDSPQWKDCVQDAGLKLDLPSLDCPSSSAGGTGG